MELDRLVTTLDGYFGTQEVRGDDWSREFAFVYPEPYWREYVEPGYEGRWNGLMVRGAPRVERVVTCVFPSDRIIAQLEARTLLFSEHPMDLADEPGFLPLSRESFETLRGRGTSFYHVHAPLDMHPEVSPSRLCARGMGLTGLDEYFPIAEGIPGGAAVIGDSDADVESLVGRVAGFLGREIPVQIVTRAREEAGRVAVVAGGGADREMLAASLERGCQTYVTGNAASRCRLEFAQDSVATFLELARAEAVTVIDATHYGTEKPTQLAMVQWFHARGMPAEFVPDGPK